MNELQARSKEINEIPLADENGIFSSELTRQEADDKVAALLEDRRTVEETEKLGGDVEIGDAKMEELARRKRRADEALAKWNSLNNELRSLKSKRSYERDAKKKAELDRKIDAKQTEVNHAKSDYENKKNSYQSYARNL